MEPYPVKCANLWKQIHKTSEAKAAKDYIIETDQSMYDSYLC